MLRAEPEHGNTNSMGLTGQLSVIGGQSRCGRAYDYQYCEVSFRDPLFRDSQ